MQPNVKPSDRARLVGVIDPDAYGAGSYSTGWVKVSDAFSFLADIFAGTLGTNATLDGKFEQAQDSGGTGAKDIAGKAISQLTQAGTDDSDKQARINLRQEELDLANDFTHARLTITVGVATSDVGAVLYAFDPRYGADLANAGSVAETVG